MNMSKPTKTFMAPSEVDHAESQCGGNVHPSEYQNILGEPFFPLLCDRAISMHNRPTTQQAPKTPVL